MTEKRQAKGLRITFYLPNPNDAAFLVARAKALGLTLGQTARLLMLRKEGLRAPTDPMEAAIENLENEGPEGRGDWLMGGPEKKEWPL